MRTPIILFPHLLSARTLLISEVVPLLGPRPLLIWPTTLVVQIMMFETMVSIVSAMVSGSYTGVSPPPPSGPVSWWWGGLSGVVRVLFWWGGGASLLPLLAFVVGVGRVGVVGWGSRLGRGIDGLLKKLGRFRSGVGWEVGVLAGCRLAGWPSECRAPTWCGVRSTFRPFLVPLPGAGLYLRHFPAQYFLL